MGAEKGNHERGKGTIPGDQRAKRWQGDASQQDPGYDGAILCLGNAESEAECGNIAEDELYWRRNGNHWKHQGVDQFERGKDESP